MSERTSQEILTDLYNSKILWKRAVGALLKIIFEFAVGAVLPFIALLSAAFLFQELSLAIRPTTTSWFPIWVAASLAMMRMMWCFSTG